MVSTVGSHRAFVVQWGHVIDPNDEDVVRHSITGKAYPSNRHPYGDFEQFYDVLRALGGQEPFIDYEQHTLKLPKN